MFISKSLTTLLVFICCCMFIFWCWFTVQIVDAPPEKWFSILDTLTESKLGKVLLLLTVNPFAVALLCTLTLVGAIGSSRTTNKDEK